jgi:hypothetical protein
VPFELNYKSGITGQTITAKTQLLGTTTLSTAISCPEIGTTGEYSGNMSGSAGRYSVSFYASGLLVDSGEIDWDGTAEITGVSINSKTVNLPADPASNAQVNTRLATSDSRLNFLDASIAARPTTPLLTTDARLNNLDAAISSRMATFSYTPPDNTTISLIANYTDSIESRLPAALVGGKMDSTATDISALATTSQLNATETSIKGASNKDLTQVFNNAPSVDLSPITAKLPTNGANIAGEGDIIKNLDAVVPAFFNYIVEGGDTFKTFLRCQMAVIAGTMSGIGTLENRFYSRNGLKIRVKTTFNTIKERISVVLDGGD